MNYLAHFYLSFGNPHWLVGQFVADEVKGRKYRLLEPELARGVLVHRFIDHFTDQDATTLALRAVIRPQLGLLSSPAIDVFFDHILAAGWSRWHQVDRDTFNLNIYRTLNAHSHLMGARSRTILHYMQQHDWLGTYAHRAGIGRIFEGMSVRVAGGELLRQAPALLHEHFSLIEASFENIFPRLEKACIKAYEKSTDLA